MVMTAKGKHRKAKAHDVELAIAANPASTMALRATRCTRCVKTWRGR